MDNPILPLLDAFKTALEGLSIGSLDIPVYSRFAPLSNSVKKYVILSSQAKTERETKCGYWWEVVMNVSIVTKYPNGKGDMTFAMVIGEAISELVQVDELTLDGFSIREARQQPTREDNFATDTEDVFVYVIPFYYKINLGTGIVNYYWLGAPSRYVDESGDYVYVQSAG